MSPGKQKCPSKACVCAVLSVVLFFGVCTIITCGFIYLKPFLQYARYRETTCRVESHFHTTQYICWCGKGCVSVYPCYLVHVSLTASDGQLWVVTLYKDDTQQSSILDLDHDKQERCSLKSCLRNKEANRLAVNAFEKQYGVRGSKINCLYDPWDVRKGAVLKVVLPSIQVLHAMTWPLVIIIVDILLCVIFCKRCRRNDKKEGCKNKNGKDEGNTIETKPLTKMEEGEAKCKPTKPCSAKGKSKKGKGKAPAKCKTHHTTDDINDGDIPLKEKPRFKTLWI